MRRRAPRILLEGAPQHPLTLRIPARRSIEISEVHRGRRKARVHLERRPQRRLGLVRPALGRIQEAQVQVRLWTIGAELLGGNVLRESAVERRPLRVTQPVPRRIGQRTRRFHAHRADGVVEQRGQELRAQRGVDALEGARRRAAHHRVAVLEPRADDLEGRRARRRTEAPERSRARDGRLVAITGDGLSSSVAPAPPIAAAPSASP